MRKRGRESWGTLMKHVVIYESSPVRDAIISRLRKRQRVKQTLKTVDMSSLLEIKYCI
jgi:hypothetical protein